MIHSRVLCPADTQKEQEPTLNSLAHEMPTCLDDGYPMEDLKLELLLIQENLLPNRI